MYYKDKPLSLNSLIYLNHSSNYAMIKSCNRRVILSIAFFFLIFYFYTLLKTDDHNFQKLSVLDDNLQTPQPKTSLIIDALLPRDDDDGAPLHSLVTPYQNGIFFYNIHEPIEFWWPFECVETQMKNSVNTKICIHETRFDKEISAQLKENGLWEPTNVRSFIRQLKEVPEANVLDLGANIGLYTLLSAKLNRTVIAVEPLHENLNRLHKAAQLEEVQGKIVAVVNALSNERTALKMSLNENNMGGSHVNNPDVSNIEDKLAPISSSVIVNGILMDDLVDIFNYKIKNATQKERRMLTRKFVVKMDIEGYEPFAFEKSSRFFKTFQIVAIFMEFGKMQEMLKNNQTSQSYLFKVKNMLRALQELVFEPYEVNGYNKLEYKDWREWPWDVYFRQCELQFCPGHVYKVSGVQN